MSGPAGHLSPILKLQFMIKSGSRSRGGTSHDIVLSHCTELQYKESCEGPSHLYQTSEPSIGHPERNFSQRIRSTVSNSYSRFWPTADDVLRAAVLFYNSCQQHSA